ncbi:MAG: PQQ-dependent sugar dehydrogenase [Candidatus Sungbacteria bacterium]|uniref:PQQ-dependent sugar dehydrogenase n=1 Tax=Candidatus Sungiibacteriota bacterium TaxID=2750080 RepID=A0A933DT69_9BACT|nr:PQQ-dependent sugar dehydrogenase [Candidatus Sungbacteria bacterium]
MDKKQIIIAAVLLAILGGFLAARKYLPALRPALFPPSQDITEFLPEDSIPPQAVNETNLPLRLPPGFRISIFAKNLPGARVMRFDSFSNMWVSRTSEGAVTLLEIDRETGQVRNQGDIFIDLRKPHGLAFDPDHPLLLYIAEEDRIRRIGTYSEDLGEDVVGLPSGDGHFTRTIAFGPDKKLYVSVGSSCNVCIEGDERRAAIIRYDPATAQSEIFARGLRNAVFFTWDFVRGKMWATDMGRDWLGDDLPPDEINIVEQGKNYGWPICYGKNIHDTDFDKNTYVRNPCMEPFEIPSLIDIPAHSAPLGLAFVPEEGWPEDYWYDLLVAYHGSWNRSSPTGYKVVRHKFDALGNYQGVEDFIIGWLRPEGALGRPVDIIVQPGGIMYLSDDKAGVIYKITLIQPPR